MDEVEFERERELVGDLEELEVAATTGRVPAGRHRSGTGVLDLLRRMRDADPDEPLWRGVRDQRLDDDHAVVDFHDPVEPHLVKRGEAEVSCHLYDDNVLARARTLTGTPPR